MSSVIFKNRVFLAQLVLAAFIVGVFAVSHSGGMEPNGRGAMSGCLFDGHAEVCKMSILEHVSAVQAMFTASHAGQNQFLLALVLLLAAAVALFTASLSAQDKNDKFNFQKLYITQHPDIPIFDSLQQAFSQGILNPRIYNTANL